MTDYQLRPQALADLEDISAYIAADSPQRAASLIREFREVFARLAEYPGAFQRRDDLSPGIRQAVHGRYLILFRMDGDDITVERVVHGARRLADLL